MTALRNCLVVLASIVAFAFVVSAEEKPEVKSDAKHAGFEKIKALRGEWQVTHGPDEHGAHEGTVSYKVTAGGSAVLETLFGGTEHEMVTLYYLEGKDLALTHYCMLQNRPHMRAEQASSPDKIVFKCREGDNKAIEAEDHMHEATFTFI